MQASELATEKQARGHLNLETARTWKIVNPSVKNTHGEPVGYKFLPGDNSFPMASPNAWWRKRARFVDHHAWVTPYREDERFAAGIIRTKAVADTVWQSGLRPNRALVNGDDVFWYTFGHAYSAPEDYPVMPTSHIGFLLKPNGFFDANPANNAAVEGQG